MPPKAELQWVDITDFTPGIISGYRTAPGVEQETDGAAQIAGTWGCVGLTHGGLGPLPRWTIERMGLGVQPADADPITEATDPTRPLYHNRLVVLDTHVIGPVNYTPPQNRPVTYDTPETDLFMVRQGWVRRRDGNKRPEPFWFLSQHSIHLDATDRNGKANFRVFALNRSEVNFHPTRWRYGGGALAETRTVHDGGDPFQYGRPCLVIAMGGPRIIGGIGPNDPEGEDAFTYRSFPDLTRENDPRDQSVPFGDGFGLRNPASILFGHQGRLVGLGRKSGYKTLRRRGYWGQEYSELPRTEAVLIWPVNNLYGFNYYEASFMEEANTGYGAFCSVSADSLILVKHTGGGVLINGDLDDPEVVRLPGLPSTGGYTTKGVMTRQGFFYASSSGVWIWTGSDTAEHASPNLDDLFWLPEDPTVPLHERETLLGSFAVKEPFVFAPNNWMMDMRTGGWWRYYPTPEQDEEEGRIFAYNNVDAQGWHYASVKSYVEPDVVTRVFHPTELRADYQWQSQPIARSRNRYLTYRQVQVLASGRGKVEVTVSGVTGESATAFVQIDNDTPAMVTKPIAITTTDVEVKIVAEAADPDDPAPTVHRVSVGYQENQSVDRDQNIRGVTPYGGT